MGNHLRNDNNKMYTPLVTVAIPFYNAEKYLSDAIQSVINQSYQRWTLYLIDDGGKDSSLRICQEAAAKDSRIIVVSDGKNKGLAARLNESVMLAKGDYYARMDADDIMDCDRISRQVEYLQTHPEVDVVGCMASIINKDNLVISKSHLVNENPRTVDDILNGARFIHPTVLGKTSWFHSNPYDQKLRRMQDLGLWLRSVDHSNFVILPDNLLFYRAVGLPTLKKDWQEFKCSNELYHQILYKEQGRKWQSFKLFCLSLFKLSVYFVFSIVGKTDYLIERRYKSMNDKEKKIAELRLADSIKL